MIGLGLDGAGQIRKSEGAGKWFPLSARFRFNSKGYGVSRYFFGQWDVYSQMVRHRPDEHIGTYHRNRQGDFTMSFFKRDINAEEIAKSLGMNVEYAAYAR